jgi:hypothetical protein
MPVKPRITAFMLQMPICAPTSGKGNITTRLTLKPISTATVSRAAPRFMVMKHMAGSQPVIGLPTQPPERCRPTPTMSWKEKGKARAAPCSVRVV